MQPQNVQFIATDRTSKDLFTLLLFCWSQGKGTSEYGLVKLLQWKCASESPPECYSADSWGSLQITRLELQELSLRIFFFYGVPKVPFPSLEFAALEWYLRWPKTCKQTQSYWFPHLKKEKHNTPMKNAVSSY